ncbi:MAG TPA: type II secretion system protein [Acidimicrobiia bacterium]|nr:type II secretion system protein [Acidimicrobiia bacterium]
MQETMEVKRDERGFTLIELLIAIVVVGILTAVAIVGIAGLTNNGKTAACQASHDAAKAASAVWYANHSTYAATFNDLTGEGDLEVPNGVTVDQPAGTHMHAGTNWAFDIGGGGANPTTFTDCP